MTRHAQPAPDRCAGSRSRPPAGWLALFAVTLLAAAPAGAQVTVSVIASDAAAGETPADNGQFVVRRDSGNMISAVTVNYAVSGSATGGTDYTALSGTVTLGLFQGQVTVPVVVAGNDAAFEGDETVTVTLQPDASGNVSIGQAAATVTIADSPHTVTAQAGPNATEDPVTAGTLSVVLGAANESGAAISVQYSVAGTASPGTDYEALPGTVDIPVGESAATIDVTPIADDLLENDETVRITLTATSDSRAPVGTPASATLSIVDDDSAGDDDGDGLSNTAECPDVADCRDSDGDGLPDYRDSDDDGDGVPTASENPPDQDTDGDNVPDYLDDNDDGDARTTREEDANEDGDGNPATNPTDLDGDDVPDYLDAQDQGGPAGDLDGDGLSNEREDEIGTDPTVADTDGDGVDDGAEDTAGTDPLDPAVFADADGDLVPDAVEAADGTDPHDGSRFVDSDSGGTPDHVETVGYESRGIPATDELDGGDDHRDLDGDGLPDRTEIASGSEPDDVDSPTGDGAGDASGNGISNAVEAWLASRGIEPVDPVSDFDRDGYPDATEVTYGLDPLRASAVDSDRDGVPDVVEVAAGADIDATTDSDADGVPDAREIALGSDPLDANSPVANGNLDDDGDGVANGIEDVLRQLGGPDDVDESSDTDGDGILDADEIRSGTDPLRDERPVPWVELRQADFGPVRALGSDGGTATATAITGGYQSGTLRYDWSASDNAVLAVVSGGQTGRSLSFAPQTLPPGPYNLVVRVQRTVGNFSSEASVVNYTFAVLPDADATDVADADNDGVPDTSDDSDARTGLANTLPGHSGAELKADAGVRLQLGSTARSTQATAAAITRQDIADAGDGFGGSTGNTADDFEYLSGIYDFEVTNLVETGAVVQVVIPQAAPIGEFPKYRKFRPDGGWSNFAVSGSDAIASAAASGGACPAPGAGAYVPGLTAGHDCVQLTIQDGGPNDADGTNGVIKDPGGVGTPQGRVTAGKGGGSTDFLTLAVLGLLAGLAGARHRRRAACALPPVLAAFFLLAPAPPAAADMFLGGGLGLSKLEPDTAGTPFSVADDQDTGFKVFGGFDLTAISPLLSVEAFFADLGQAPLEDTGRVDYSVYGAGLSLGVSSLKTPRLSGFVEGGIAQLNISADVPFSQQDDTSLFLGLAGSYAVRRNWYLQLEYEYFAEDAQFLSLSIIRRFRSSGSHAKTIPLPDRRNDAGREID